MPRGDEHELGPLAVPLAYLDLIADGQSQRARSMASRLHEGGGERVSVAVVRTFRIRAWSMHC
ncbi:MAG: hypothetical protein H0U28_12725 [Nocardioidaceae bacterium]|nr:hypothetical protein [Nocardioidaceae bacterium]